LTHIRDSLSALGYDHGPWAALLSPIAPPDRHARVVRADRGAVTVATSHGERRVTLTHGDPPVATGDWIALPPDGRPGLAGVAPRRTAITRPAHHRGFRTDNPDNDHVLAANADLVGVAVPLHADVNVRRLERGLVLAYEAGATPVVVLTKADLLPWEDLASVVARVEVASPGVDIIVTSAATGSGVDELRALLAPGRTLVVLGASGAGKSSVINAVAGDERMAIQAVRRADGKGRHTTTHRELVPLATGGAIMDTPGLRALSLAQVGAGLELAFSDVEVFAASCRFSDCRHEGEPDCAVAEALEDGALDPDRFEGWVRIRAESENAALRADKARYRRVARRRARVGSAAMERRRRLRGE
jgi:ribosome biogenesis GTPase